MSFLDKFLASVSRFPGRNAFCIQEQTYTYAQLGSHVAAIQRELVTQCGAEDRIGVIASDDIETYAALLAIMLLGKTYIPIGPTDPRDRVEQVVSQSGMRTICSVTALEGYNDIRNLVLNKQEMTGHREMNYEQFPPEDRYAYILFTSGSTGKPKGVPLTFANLDAFMNAFFALGYEVNEHDRFLQMFDLTFDLSVMSYMAPLCVGACVYTASGKGSKYANIYTVLEEHQVTFALMVPSILSFLRPYFGEVVLPAMRYSLFCGEALHTAVTKEWLNCVPNAVVENVYGPTEATIFCTTYRIPRTGDIEDSNGIVSIGTPMQDMEAVVFDNGQKVTDGAKGELCLHGLQVTKGYLDEEKTKAAFFEQEGKRYYRTGDIAYKNERGNLIYSGRADHQVKIQGFRIELGEIEHHLKEAAGKRNAIAIAMEDAATGNTWLAAAIEGAPVPTDPITEQLRSKLPHYMIPAQLHFIATFPLNVNGKTDRNAIKKLITA